MAHDAPQATGPSKLVVRNIGLLLSGALEKPILDADTIVAENGKITAIGRLKDVDTEGATTVVNANGTTVAPGLIDSHVHPVAGDWTPRQNQMGWIDSYLHGGVTTMISAGMDFHAAGPQIPERALCKNRHRLDADHVAGSAWHVHFAG